MESLRIISTGLAVPALVTNQDIMEMLPDLGITREWLDKNVGIEQRHIAIDGMQHQPPKGQPRPVFEKRAPLKPAPGCCNSDLCAKAIKDAVARCPSNNLQLSDVDMIIVTTVTPDMPVPSTSTFVMDKLDLNGVKTIDIRSACCGFTIGLQTAAAHLTSPVCGGDIRTVAVVGCEVGSVFGNLDPKDPHYTRGDAVNAAMIGDAAACVIVHRFDKEDEDNGELPFGHELLHVDFKCIGRGKEPGMHMPSGGCLDPASALFFHHDFKSVLQHGAELYHGAIRNGLEFLSKSERFAQLRQGQVTDPLLLSEEERKKTKKATRASCAAPTIEDCDVFIAHQANARISDYAKGMGIDEEKMHKHFYRYGNTANASIPLSLHLEGLKNNEGAGGAGLKEGSLVMTLAAESTKWLTGTVVLVWHPLTREAYLARQKSGAGGAVATDRSAFAGGFSRQMRRWKKQSWFYIAGWLILFMAIFGPALVTLSSYVSGGGKKKQHK